MPFCLLPFNYYLILIFFPLGIFTCYAVMEDLPDKTVNTKPEGVWGTALLLVSISTGCIVLATCFFRGYVRFRTSTYVRLNDIYVALAVVRKEQRREEAAA